MAQKVHTTLTDDLDPDVEATGTVMFALDGATYEIDLSDEHTAELRATVAPYVAAGRKVGGPRTPGAPGVRPRPAPPSAPTTGRTRAPCERGPASTTSPSTTEAGSRPRSSRSSSRPPAPSRAYGTLACEPSTNRKRHVPLALSTRTGPGVTGV